MTCPKCHGQMRQYERSGVTIDQCTECRGVFLDRGELEKLMDAEANWNNARATQTAPPPAAAQPHYPAAQPAYGHQQPAYGHHGYHGHYKHRKQKGFLGELFD